MSLVRKHNQAVSRRTALASIIGAAFFARLPALRPTAPCGDMERMAAAMLCAWPNLKGAQIGIGGEMFIGSLFKPYPTSQS